MHGFYAEFQQTLGEITNAKTDWRSLGRRALPVAAAAAAVTGALCIRRQAAPPERRLLQQRACFDCQPADGSAGRGHLPPVGALDGFLQARGEDGGALRRAARRMRGPIESDLLAAERTLVAEGVAGPGATARRHQLYDGLLEKWRASGYLSEPLEYKKPRAATLGFDLVTQQDESYGRDVGCQVPLCVLETDAKSMERLGCLSAEDTAAASESMAKHGFAMLRSMVRQEDVVAMRERLHMKISALDHARARRGGLAPVREYDISPLQEADPDLEPVMSTAGRRHLYLRNRPGEMDVRDLQAGLMPLVWEYATKAREAAGLPAERKLYVSEVQLLVSDPCAIDQFWHVDNTQPGVTVLLPLTPVPADIGPTVFLPGSHRLMGDVPDGSRGLLSRLSGFGSALLNSDGVEVASMSAGDAIIYDARLVHYGAANRLYDRTRVALVFRYDFERPPGMAFIGTQLISWTGNICGQFLRFYTSLPGSPSTAA